ncbi:SDR family NAD(P)-dependent oxidoreductase [Primorskyibacter aestuariivivens]|uniref:SDR family NAD(P)-dependent oxidoreductase n=1 Tax=Primorskyibacter aestuariivivens TaxID=1888912 RepID=UPI0022FFFFF6|nr:SDR family NAD(P)-dependent oxidoreductase [Primorskyibacter aestuariivivens]MDA7429650.1 SDR family NAD(P)-dependent oxidoreductase [Primorskyibacter aestuariivivens]
MRKSILITGCSSGIGRDAAEGLNRRGWRVFASCRKERDCAALRDAGFESPLIDYADPESIRTGLAEVLEATGGTLDALFNNGAYALPGAVEDLPREGLAELFETNVFGVHDLTRLVIPVMRGQGHGRIVNCSSVLGLVPAPWRGAYVASKYAMEGLTDTLRLEMRDTPIKVILIEPGPVTSKIRVNSIPHFERWIDWRGSARAEQYETRLLKRLYDKRGPDRFELLPEAVTEKLWRALEDPSPRARYFVTTPTYVFGTLRHIVPTSWMDWILAKG